MKKLLLIALLLGSCKKENVNVLYSAGTMFNVKNISLVSLAQMHDGVNVVPENPFTIDDIWPNSQDANLTYYVCHSANGNQYKMPENDMEILSTRAAITPVVTSTK